MLNKNSPIEDDKQEEESVCQREERDGMRGGGEIEREREGL